MTVMIVSISLVSRLSVQVLSLSLSVNQKKKNHVFAHLFLSAWRPSCEASRGLEVEIRGLQVEPQILVSLLLPLDHKHREPAAASGAARKNSSWNTSESCQQTDRRGPTDGHVQAGPSQRSSVSFTLLSPCPTLKHWLTDTARYSAVRRRYQPRIRSRVDKQPEHTCCSPKTNQRLPSSVTHDPLYSLTCSAIRWTLVLFSCRPISLWHARNCLFSITIREIREQLSW